MSLEEQLEELEALEAIYPDDYTELSRESPISFKLNVRTDEDEDSDAVRPFLTITFTCPEDYPNVVPVLQVEGFMVPDTLITHIEEKLIATLDDNIGMIMAFTVGAEAKDLLTDGLENIKEIEAEIERKKQEAANARHGTMVTKELFLKWRENFEAEIAAKIAKAAKTESKQAKKDNKNIIPGRILFLNSLESGKEASMEVDESLFDVDEDLEGA